MMLLTPLSVQQVNGQLSGGANFCAGEADMPDRSVERPDGEDQRYARHDHQQ
jgi:hypothetical protein